MTSLKSSIEVATKEFINSIFTAIRHATISEILIEPGSTIRFSALKIKRRRKAKRHLTVLKTAHAIKPEEQKSSSTSKKAKKIKAA